MAVCVCMVVCVCVSVWLSMSVVCVVVCVCGSVWLPMGVVCVWLCVCEVVYQFIQDRAAVNQNVWFQVLPHPPRPLWALALTFQHQHG